MIHEGLADSDAELLYRHMEHCEVCQADAESIAATRDEWANVIEALSGRDELPEFNQIPLSSESVMSPIHWSESMAKQLLAPARHPENLGRLGRYEIERLVGVGGMGIVFKAFDSELNRPVAIKVLAPYLAGNGTARKRFAREARAAAAVVHQHVVPIHNVETDREAPFLVMHYVAGEALQSRINRQGNLGIVEILRIGIQVASGLAAAHQQGLVHRDIKPSNILLEEANVERALITDFGLARAADDVEVTRTGASIGTPLYMSPEQARGDAVDQKSDLFSLGSVLYTMCTGRPAFRAETTFGVIRRIIEDEPRSIREINPETPEWMTTMIAKLMAKERENRFESAEVVQSILEQCLNHVQNPDSNPLPEKLARLGEAKWMFSRKAILLGTAAALSFVLASIVIASQFNERFAAVGPEGQLQDAAAKQEEEKRSSDQGKKGDKNQTSEKNDVDKRQSQVKSKVSREEISAYAKQIQSAQKALHRGGGQELRDLLRSTEPKLRGWEFEFLQNQAMNIGKEGSTRKRSMAKGPAVNGLAFTNDGRRLIVADSSKQVKVWDIATNKVTELEGHAAAVLCVAVSPNGKLAATGSWDGYVCLWEIETGKLKAKYKGHNPEERRPGDHETGKVRSLCFSPDNARIVSTAFPNSPFAKRASDIKVWSVDTLQTIHDFVGQHEFGRRNSVVSVTYSPDGSLIASGGYDRILRVWSAKTGREISHFEGHTNNVLGIAFRPGHEQIASASTDRSLAVWNLETGKEMFRMKGHRLPVFSVVYSPDGKRIFSAGYDNSVTVWDAETGIELITFDDLPGPIRTVAISSNGKHLAAGGGSPGRNAEATVWSTSDFKVENK